MTIASLYPSVRPSLLLDFANTKQLDPRITFSRPTTATYYDGKTVVKAEENLFIYSQDFDNGAWAKANSSTTANTIAAPDGTTTADTLTASAGTGIVPRVTLATLSGSAGVHHVSSVFAKAGTLNYLQITTVASTSTYCNFDLSNGTLGTSSNCVGSITSVGNGWYRCSILFTSATTDLRVMFVLRDTVNSNYSVWNPVGTESIYLWGAQLEQRSVATAYTPTTTAPITNYIPALQTAVTNDARFDHDPVTGESKGLLIEEQRTNLLTYSEQFDNAAWTKVNATVTANTIVAPDGTLTGDKLVEAATTGNHQVQRTGISITSGAQYSFSVYLKAAERTQAQLQYYDGTTNKYPIFNLIDGTKVVDNGIGSNWLSTNVGNGWWRFTIIVTSATATTNVYIYPAVGGSNGYTGDGYSGIYIWGAQLEAGSFPTSYIPTVASQVTRSADSASMTGSNFSSWYRADEGTLFCEGAMPASATYGAACYMTKADNTNNNLVGLLVDTRTAYTASITTNSSAQTAWTFSSQSPNTFYKHTLSYKTNDAAYTSNGSAVLTDASVTLPSLADIRIGASGTQTLGGYIKRIAYYPKRLSNVELQGLTS